LILGSGVSCRCVLKEETKRNKKKWRGGTGVVNSRDRRGGVGDVKM